MTLTRRSAIAAVAAAIATPAAADQIIASGPGNHAVHIMLEWPKPLVVAHRGASGERPEHTAAAYKKAIAEGADFIEPDLVISKDGHLVARHENEIGGTTDVASRPEFAARKATKVIDGQSIEGWFTEDFMLAELKTLRCRERLPQLRPGNTKYDGRDSILTFQEVVSIARLHGVGVYPEMKHPTYFASVGLPFEQRMADAVKAAYLEGDEGHYIFVQCFEVAPLKRLRTLTTAPLVQLVDSEGSPADAPGYSYADMVTASGLKAIAAYADGVGPDKSLVVPTDGKVLLPATALVRDAHAVGLKVHPWTVRAENYFLPESLKRGLPARPDYPRLHGDVAAMFKALYDAGVDGVFSDFPGLAVDARKTWKPT